MELKNLKYSIKKPNGYGKTSWLHNYVKDNQDKTSISYLPQNCTLFEKLTIAQNIKLFLLDDELIKFDEYLSKLLVVDHKTKIYELSVGQKRKVEIAIALAKNAELYVFDEPLNNLDKKARLIVAKMISEINKPVIFVDHLKVVSYDELIDIPKVKKERYLKYKPNFQVLLAEFKNETILSKILIVLFTIMLLLSTLSFAKSASFDYYQRGYKVVYGDDGLTSVTCDYLDPSYSGVIPIVENDQIPDEYMYMSDPGFLKNYYSRYSLPLNLKGRFGYAVVGFNVESEYVQELLKNDTYYEIYGLKTGTWPKDYSNQVAITTFMQEVLDKNRIVDKADTIGYTFDFQGGEYEISGVYINQVNSPQKIMYSYHGADGGDCSIVANDTPSVDVKSELKNFINYTIRAIVFIIIITILLYRLLRTTIKNEQERLMSHQLIYSIISLVTIVYIFGLIFYFNTPV